MYTVYVLISLKDGKHYIGSTSDLRRRLKQHESGQVQSTVNRRPLRLEYYEEAPTKEASLTRERYFKTAAGRRNLRRQLDRQKSGGTAPFEISN